MCVERRVRLSVSLRDCSGRNVSVCGIARLGMFSRVTCFLAHPRRTFVGLDCDFTVRKSGEQTVVREVQSRSEDDALVDLLAYSSSSSKPLDLHACVDKVLVAIIHSVESEVDNFFSFFFESKLAIGATVLCKHVQPQFILSGMKSAQDPESDHFGRCFGIPSNDYLTIFSAIAVDQFFGCESTEFSVVHVCRGTRFSTRPGG